MVDFNIFDGILEGSVDQVSFVSLSHLFLEINRGHEIILNALASLISRLYPFLAQHILKVIFGLFGIPASLTLILSFTVHINMELRGTTVPLSLLSHLFQLLGLFGLAGLHLALDDGCPGSRSLLIFTIEYHALAVYGFILADSLQLTSAASTRLDV